MKKEKQERENVDDRNRETERQKDTEREREKERERKGEREREREREKEKEREERDALPHHADTVRIVTIEAARGVELGLEHAFISKLPESRLEKVREVVALLESEDGGVISDALGRFLFF